MARAGATHAVVDVIAFAAVVIAHLHVEPGAALGDGLADPAQAHDAQLLAADAQAQRDAAMHLAPLAGAHEPFTLAHAAGASDQEAPGQVCYAIRQHVGRIADLHAALMRRLDVDGLVAHAPAADRLQVG
ncbi:hypothetical protein G6F22_019059 [Rhizopus arrhizus]|nr:hypothetical protein G6F22_019059 [Rhizopus arrhizus]